MLGWELPPHNSGGLGVACLYLSKALAKHGVNIDFVVPYEAEHAEIKHMRVLSALKLNPLYKWGGAYEHDFIETKTAVQNNTGKTTFMSIRDVQKDYAKFVEKYLMQYKPDLVHAHDWLTFEMGLLAKKNFGIPLIAHVHATEYDRAGMNNGYPLAHAVEREGLMLADKILAVSNNTKKLIHDKYHIPLDKIDVVYNSLGDNFLLSDYAYDKNNFKYLELLKSSGYKIIATVGRFTLQKGLSHLMRAAAKALSKDSKLIFVFAGDGEQKNQLMQMATNFGISRNVIFTGFLRGRELRDIYSVSDIFVMSSISEPFGLTALEAAHHGDALILTKQSGVAEIIRSAMTYDFWDEEKLANSIVAIAHSKALMDTLQSGMRREYRRLSWDDIAQKCLNIYNEVNNHKRNQS